MPSRARDILVFFAAVAVFGIGVALAQPEAATVSEEGTPPVAPAPPRVREIGPSTYYVKDDSGKLVPVLNLSLAELHRLLELDAQQAGAVPQLPTYALQELSVQGLAKGARADLTVKATVRLLTDGWVRVPIGLDNAVLRETPDFEGQGEAIVTCADLDEGYVCYLRAARGERCDLTFKLLTSIEQVGNEWRLDLQIPQATSSALDFQVPLPRATATVSDGLLQIEDADNASKFIVTGMGGDFRLAWRKGDVKTANPRPLLDAVFEQVVKVDGVRQVTADVRVKVSSLRGEFDSFILNLPKGARLFPRQFNQSGVQLSELPEPDEDGHQLIQVKLDRATAASIEVQVLIEYLPVNNGKAVEYDLGGMGIEGSFRQSGTIDFAVRDDLSLTWKPTASVQRTFVPESLRQKIAARFEVNRQVYGLQMQVALRETQVSVEPSYRLHVDSRRVQLDATLKYRVRGTALYGLNVALPGWQVTQITPEAMLETESLDLTPGDNLFIPLSNAAMSDNNEFTLQITAQQEIAEGAEQISIVMPRPEARSLSPASIVVLPADNVELNFSEEQSEGLERDPFPPELALPEGQRRPLFFRERSESADTILSAQLAVRKRLVSIGAETDIRLDAASARIEQRFAYRVSFEPLNRLHFIVPRRTLDNGGLRFVADQLALPVTEFQTESTDGDSAPGGEMVRVTVDPLGELIGVHEIVVQHTQSLDGLPSEQESVVDLALVQPWLENGTIVTDRTLRIQNGGDWSVRVEDPRWDAIETRAADRAETITLTSDGASASVSLRLTPRELGQQTSTVVSRTWIETRLGSSVRRDRAVFRISTNQEQVAVRLPKGARLQRLGLDGHRVTDYAVREQRIVVIDVPTKDELVLELWYDLDSPYESLSQLDIEIPQVVDARSSQQVYWTLATPPDVHLVVPPATVTPELNWLGHSFFWGRLPELQLKSLERWVGASPQTQSLPEAANKYLFSSLGTPDRLQFRLATRGVILIAMSGLTLVIGLLLIYVAPLRHPGVLFVAALLVLTSILWYPDLSVALLQASMLGVVLVLFACGLRWFFDYRYSGTAVIHGTAYASPDSKTIKATASDVNIDSLPTTSTAPVQISAVEPEA